MVLKHSVYYYIFLIFQELMPDIVYSVPEKVKVCIYFYFFVYFYFLIK